MEEEKEKEVIETIAKGKKEKRIKERMLEVRTKRLVRMGMEEEKEKEVIETIAKGKKEKKNKGKNAGSENKKASRNNKDMDDSTYNKLWCFDLSLEQILEKCVEN